MSTWRRSSLVVLLWAAVGSPAWAAPVPLQNATATGSQNGFPVWDALDGNSGTGWAVGTQPYTAAFETSVDVGYAGGTELAFLLDHQTIYGQHNLGRFRLSVTTDPRDTFADGLANGGNVMADWTLLLPVGMGSAGGAALARSADGTIVVTGTNPATDTYTITALTHLTGITGVRLETFHEPAQPQTPGPGRASNRNFVLTDFALSEAPYTGPPRWNADAGGAWSNPANWVGGVPNAPGATAEFSSIITMPRTVTVDSPVTVGTVHFDNPHAYTVGGPGTLTLQGSAGTAAIVAESGNHRITAPVALNDPTTVRVAGGNMLSLEGGVGGPGGLIKQGGGTLLVKQTSYDGATVIAEGTLRLSNPAVPTSPVPGSTAWFDATDADTLTRSGNNVTAWESKVGTNQLTGVNPGTITYDTSGGGPNDLPYVNTNAANKDGNSFFNLQSDIGDARTLFMVFKPTAHPNQYTPFFGRNTGEGGNYMGVAPGGNGYVENTFSAPGLRTTGSTPGQWYLDGTAFDPVSAALSLTDYRVVSVVAGANVPIHNIGTDRSIGGRFLAADIGEILVYSSPLSDVDRRAVEAYLLSKWLGETPAGYGPGNLPASTVLQIGAAGTFDLNGSDQTVASLADYDGGGGTVTNSSYGTPVVLTLAADSGSATFSGSITDGAGSVSLVKTGGGTQVLAGPGASTYTGGTTVNAGVLEVARGHNDQSGLGTGPVVINAGTVRLTNNTYNALGLTYLPVTIEAGGVLTADNTANNAHNLGLLTLHGGMLTSINGPAGPANDGGYGNFVLNSGVTVGGTAMSTISATTVSLRNPGGIFHVPEVAEGTDLLVLSRIINYSDQASTLTKTGAGILELRGDNTYTGATTVSEGTLLVSNSTGSGTGSGAVTVGPGAVLGGTGRIGGNVEIAGGGSLAPGESIGTLYLDGGNLTFRQGAFFDIDLAWDEQELGIADLVQMDGAMLSPNEATVRVNLAFSPDLGDSWTILDGAGGRDGMFDTNVLVAGGSEFLDGGKWLEVGYGASDGNHWVFLTAVPEPGTGLLLLLALACGLTSRRRRS